MLSESLFTLNHSASDAISSFTSLYNSLILQPEQYSVVSSANNMQVVHRSDPGKSFV